MARNYQLYMRDFSKHKIRNFHGMLPVNNLLHGLTLLMALGGIGSVLANPPPPDVYRGCVPEGTELKDSEQCKAEGKNDICQIKLDGSFGGCIANTDAPAVAAACPKGFNATVFPKDLTVDASEVKLSCSVDKGCCCQSAHSKASFDKTATCDRGVRKYCDESEDLDLIRSNVCNNSKPAPEPAHCGPPNKNITCLTHCLWKEVNSSIITQCDETAKECSEVTLTKPRSVDCVKGKCCCFPTAAQPCDQSEATIISKFCQIPDNFNSNACIIKCSGKNCSRTNKETACKATVNNASISDLVCDANCPPTQPIATTFCSDHDDTCCCVPSLTRDCSKSNISKAYCDLMDKDKHPLCVAPEDSVSAGLLSPQLFFTLILAIFNLLAV